jgi:hypothetical protein
VPSGLLHAIVIELMRDDLQSLGTRGHAGHGNGERLCFHFVIMPQIVNLTLRGTTATLAP